MTKDDLRNKAVASIKRKNSFWRYVGVWISIGALMVAIWWFSTPAGYFWPIWPILGMAVPPPFMGFSAYGPAKTISEERIRVEMKRLSA